MEIASLTAKELCVWLVDKIDSSSLERIEGIPVVLTKTKVAYVLFSASDLDGETLTLLVDDFNEFSSVIPKAGSRLKLKKLIRENSVVTLDVRTFI